MNRLVGRMPEVPNNPIGNMTAAANACALPACRGFSLIELLIVLAIAAILINVAAPSFSDVMVNVKMGARENALSQSIHFGRSEAVKRTSPVSICARSTDTACNTNNDWSGGWLVYTDSKLDGSPGQLDAGDTVLRVVSFSSNNIDTTASAVVGTGADSPVNNIRFNSRGFANWKAGTFVLCLDDDADIARSVIVLSAGSVRSTSASATTAAKNAFGMDVTCS